MGTTQVAFRVKKREIKDLTEELVVYAGEEGMSLVDFFPRGAGYDYNINVEGAVSEGCFLISGGDEALC